MTREPRRVAILLAPQRMVVGHRLAPVGHGEVRIDRLHLDERLARILVLEAVQQQHRADEGLLGLGSTRVGEVDASQLLAGREQGSDTDDADGEQDGQATGTRHDGIPLRSISLDSSR